MGELLNGYIMPHPPVLIRQVGRGRQMMAQKTVNAMKRVGKEIGEQKPTTIVISSPHSPCFQDFVYLYDNPTLAGDFSEFGTPEVHLSVQNNISLTKEIKKQIKQIGIQAGTMSSQKKVSFNIEDKLDHGVMVPLWFIMKEWESFQLVCISTPWMDFRQIYQLGKAIRRAVEKSNERVIYIASGDLSHRLVEDAPAGYSPNGLAYDLSLTDKIRKNDVGGIISTDMKLVEEAGECGTRSIIMMYGSFDQQDFRPEVYSYEGPFGVGYLVACLGIQSQAVRLAEQALSMWVREGKRMEVPEWISPEFRKKRGGVFVSLKKGGQLRGCMGTIGPVCVNLAEEIICNSISSGTKDPRFQDVTEDELPAIIYSVDVLGKPEKIKSLKELNVKKYGVIVTAGYKRGLLLPDLDGIKSEEEQVEIALEKAGIHKNESFELHRFEVVRYR